MVSLYALVVVTYLNLSQNESKPMGRDFHPLATSWIYKEENEHFEWTKKEKEIVNLAH